MSSNLNVLYRLWFWMLLFQQVAVFAEVVECLAVAEAGCQGKVFEGNNPALALFMFSAFGFRVVKSLCHTLSLPCILFYLLTMTEWHTWKLNNKSFPYKVVSSVNYGNSNGKQTNSLWSDTSHIYSKLWNFDLLRPWCFLAIKTGNTRAWWWLGMPLIPAFGRQSSRSLWILGQPGL